MSNLIKVVVDLPLRKLNKEYDYILPSRLQGKIKVGQLVRVPFGRRKITAFVTEINADADIEADKLKKVDSLLYEQSFFDNKMLKLFRWTASYYHAYLAQVIKSALPPGITAGKVNKQKLKYLKINKEKDLKKELKQLQKRAPKQFMILEYLCQQRNEKKELKEVLNYAETSRPTVERLIDKDLISLYTVIKDRIPAVDSQLDFKNEIAAADKKNYQAEEKFLKAVFEVDFKKEFSKFLLQTNIYDRKIELLFKLLRRAVKEQNNVIFLIPEIEKDYSILRELKKEFEPNIAFLHSSLSAGERFDEWQRIKRGEVQLVVGARSAVFAPLEEIDLIIILEENNESYKQQEHPLYQARQIAVRRLNDHKGALILESPFPAVESKYFAEKAIYQEFEFKAAEAKINTEIIDMKKEIEAGNLADLSSELTGQITDYLQKNKKIMLFLNRRGTANYVICRKCGHLLKCDNCDISLNYHQDQEILSCHHCGFKKKLPEECPECGSHFLSTSGVGTENIITQLQSSFKEAKIARVDSDQPQQKVDNLLNAFKKGNIDILIGTSLILKHHFYDDLQLLAVISADTALNSSDFRSAENNFTLLSELKSLLKNEKQSNFIIQSYQPSHYSIQSAAADNYYSFYTQEKEIRAQRRYPPFCRLLNILISGQNEVEVEKRSKELSNYLDQYQTKFLEKLEAVPAVLSKIRNKYRWQIIMKFDSLRSREYIVQLIEKTFIDKGDNNSTQIRIDVDPYQML